MSAAIQAVCRGPGAPDGARPRAAPGRAAWPTSSRRALPDVADRLVAGLGARLASLFAHRRARLERGLRAPPRLAPAAPPDVPARLDPRRPRAPALPVDRGEAPVRELVRARGDGHVRPRRPRATPTPPGSACTTTGPRASGRCARTSPTTGSVPRVEGAFHPFRPVTGEGVFHVPVGPVHAGIIEPGHFRFGVAGEPDPLPAAPPLLRAQGHREALRAAAVAPRALPRRVDLRRHRGGPRARLRPRDRAARPAVEPPPRARYLRVVLLELERVYNHIADIGAIATDVAFTVPAAHAQLLRERPRLAPGAALRLAPPAGHGGARRREDATSRPRRREELLAHLGRLEADFESPRDAAHRLGQLHRPVDGTGVLPDGGGPGPRRRRARRAGLRPRRGPAPRPPARRLRRAALRGAGRGGRRRARAPDGAGAGGGAVARDPRAGAGRAARRSRCARRSAGRAARLLRRPWAGPRGGAARACTGCETDAHGALDPRQGHRPELPELARRSCTPCPATSSRTSPSSTRASTCRTRATTGRTRRSDVQDPGPQRPNRDRRPSRDPLAPRPHLRLPGDRLRAVHRLRRLRARLPDGGDPGRPARRPGSPDSVVRSPTGRASSAASASRPARSRR